MMKVVQINTTCGIGSTGKICVEISKLLKRKNVENYILYSYKTNGCELGISCLNKYSVKLQAIKSRIFGNYGFNSKKATKKMIDELERINPDIVHLHNIHGHDCNLEVLFKYLKKKNIKIVWTFHDCWAFTAYCPHFTISKCEKWKKECCNCPMYHKYSWFRDRSASLFQKKKNMIQGQNLTIVTPSEWLARLVNQSIFKEYKTHIINNGIDLSIFNNKEKSIREKFNISSNKIILLGVSFIWDEKKGLDVFIELSKRLDNDRFQIVLVGTNSKIDKTLPENIISIHKTNNQVELAEIYSSADFFINPSREENYPTVNMEAIACGTPVITFNTGGSAEIVDNATGVVVNYDDIDELERVINKICGEKKAFTEACIDKSKQFNANERFEEYVDLYEALL